MRWIPLSRPKNGKPALPSRQAPLALPRGRPLPRPGAAVPSTSATSTAQPAVTGGPDDGGVNTIVRPFGIRPLARGSICGNEQAFATGRTIGQVALVRADETLADRTRFGLDADRWKAFMEALDAPPREIPRLGRLLKEPSVFEGGD